MTQQEEESKKPLGLASRAVHADDKISAHRAVAPPMHVSTTFAYDKDPAKLVPNENVDVSQRAQRAHLQASSKRTPSGARGARVRD